MVSAVTAFMARFLFLRPLLIKFAAWRGVTRYRAFVLSTQAENGVTGAAADHNNNSIIIFEESFSPHGWCVACLHAGDKNTSAEDAPVHS